MSDRLSSGSERLDDVLGGGLPLHGITLIVGPPGAGKTILAEQYLFQNAREDRPGIYLSTVSEPFDKMLRYGQSMTFFDADAIGTSIFYDDTFGLNEAQPLVVLSVTSDSHWGAEGVVTSTAISRLSPEP